jgi:hypothetical protein
MSPEVESKMKWSQRFESLKPLKYRPSCHEGKQIDPCLELIIIRNFLFTITESTPANHD